MRVQSPRPYESINQELEQHTTPIGTPDWDAVRRSKLKALEAYTKRPALVYAVDFLNTGKAKAVGNDLQIDFNDKHGFFEIINQINDKAVDVIVHSPGGLAEATESIILRLRGKFDDVRFIVPNIAKSAATMMVMSGNEILMDCNAELGPIDPQFGFQKGDGSIVQAPGQAIVDQFEEAQALIGKDPSKLPAWLPILQQFINKRRMRLSCRKRSLRSGWPNTCSRAMRKARKRRKTSQRIWATTTKPISRSPDWASGSAGSRREDQELGRR